ncbi:MAG: enoyl-CoA hydratase/isomerase family protein, partial [Rhodospirillaceae bacterium]|nr:enoyl-CoA hydratase/isomerase family protein [Rhodospirillaceae bacterium]
FCAGGDIRALYDSGKTPSDSLTRDFYRVEYRLNRLIKRYPKPYIAAIDGVVMGGGVGVSVHGSHRVATERSLFAMPETGIGFFPDVGGSCFLPRLPGRIGFYLALTGARLRAADCLYAGIATHHAPSERLAGLEAALAESDGGIDRILDGFHTAPGPGPLAERRAEIDRLFARDSVEAIMAALAAEDTDWASSVRKVMAAKAPLSQKATLRQLARGATLEFEDCMVMEYRMSQAAMAAPDFYEGVRAAVLDKDQKPAWKPATLEDATEAMVDVWFAPPPEGDLAFDD